MSLKEIFEKQGGKALLKQYWQSGAFFTAASEFLLLGKSRTALEILRLAAQFKTKQKLEKQYRDELLRFDEQFDTSLPHAASNKVWVCWFQGMENAPQLVQKCYRSLCENLTDRDVTLITEKNMDDYVQFPSYILEKWKNGQITHTHMTDLLRLELLIRYGGMWIDATVFCSEKRENIPNYYFDSDLFMYQNLKPGRDGHVHYISSWLIAAKSNNRVLMAVRHLCYAYWKNNTQMADYFLLHDFISVALEHYFEEWKKIIPCSNSAPHVLLLRLFEPYDAKIWEAVREQTPFHKLTYKFSEDQIQQAGTYYDVLFGANR